MVFARFLGERLTCGCKNHHHPYPSAISHPQEKCRSECKGIQGRDDDGNIKRRCVIVVREGHG